MRNNEERRGRRIRMKDKKETIMKFWRTWLAISLALLFCYGTLASSGGQKKETERAASARSATPSTAARDYPVKPVPFTSVHFNDAFWAPRLEINRKVTIPFAFKKDEETKRIYNFERAAAALRGETLKDKTPPGYPFDDTDVYKVIEGAAYALNVQPDPELEAYVDGLIAKIGAAQEADGYLYTTRTIDPEHPHVWAGKKRWELEKVDSHELYDLGHLYEAAVAYYQATGKRSLLDIAVKTADLLDQTFGPGKQSIWPGHQITEMGLAKLYRVTGDPRYLNLAKFMLDARGPDGSRGSGRKYNQSHAKVVDQTEAVGPGVRATYMYSGMADVAALTGDLSYVNAIDKIWEDVAEKKLYITGGIGATGSGEAFGTAYELPNMSAYNETCAAVGNDFWNQRLFLLHADAKYIDVMEGTLYPWDGAVKMTVSPDRSSNLTLNVRIPGWARGEAVPSNLYRFVDKADEPVVLKVNGASVSAHVEKGYASVTRKWKRGDVVELNLPMPVRRIEANELVKADRGRIALQRGPIVYAAEGVDNPGGRVRNLVLPNDAKLNAEFRPDLLNGVEIVKARAVSLAYDEQGKVSRKDQDFVAIPYYAWANRGNGEMLVWIPNDESNARALPFPTIASTSKVLTSGGQSPFAVNDLAEPQSSNDHSNPYFHWWPRKGTTEWVEYTFAKPTSVSETDLYWFDDTGGGECRVPKSWRLLYKDGETWKAVESAMPYGTEKDKYNHVSFKPVMTTGLRLEVTLQSQWSAGIQEWK